jgi:hypothetical protein
MESTNKEKIKKVKVVKESKEIKKPKVKEIKETKTKEKELKEPDANDLQNKVVKQSDNISIDIKPKRGRKPNASKIMTNDNSVTSVISENKMNDNEIFVKDIKSDEMNDFSQHSEKCENTVFANEILCEPCEDNIIKQVAKKRGRKPKGGKIIVPSTIINKQPISKPNVILHLKCFMKDLQTNNILPNNQIESYNFPTSKNDLNFDILNPINNLISNNIYSSNELIADSDGDGENTQDDMDSHYKKNDQKELWRKLKSLEHNLHINNINDKKSCCFWDTYEFDNPPVHIPKHYIKESYQVYGCFCSPECAVAYLMNENIDVSVKFERYHLLNHIYGKIYNYNRNVKPAPIPYYMLDRFYGNLNIQEYRSLLRKERLFLIVDKPLTRILPELHEDNDEFILNNKIIPSNSQQTKKKIQKTNQNKSIMSEHFGL